MTFPLLNLPNELLVKIFGLLEFDDFISMKSTCKVAKNVAEKNVKFMPKKEKDSMRIYFGFRRIGNCLTIVETCLDGKKKTLTFGSDENLMLYLSNLKIINRFFIDAYNPSFISHFTIGSLIENVEILNLSNIKIPMSATEILPLFKACKKLNHFCLESGSLINGKLLTLVDQMNYCYSVRCHGESNLEIDNECLQIISSKSTELTPVLQIFVPEIPSSITLTALVEFLRSTIFLQNSSISLSRVIGTRHELISSFFPLIRLLHFEATLYDFEAMISVSEDVYIRLNICNFQAPVLD
uniref:F-box domain-containing protein n=1 Tax=Panagrolaimus superbus TaxID=310955 RepID=A0A914YCV3_9BILA